jgi:hypothetical protein
MLSIVIKQAFAQSVIDMDCCANVTMTTEGCDVGLPCPSLCLACYSLAYCRGALAGLPQIDQDMPFPASFPSQENARTG